MQQAARDATIEGAAGQESKIDARVAHAVRQIVPSARISFSRKAYATFSEVGQPEDFSDIDGNGTCNDGEPFEDANDNGTWDRDRGTDGFGGARHPAPAAEGDAGSLHALSAASWPAVHAALREAGWDTRTVYLDGDGGFLATEPAD